MDYLEKKSELLFANNEIDQINTLLMNFESFILTSEKITIRDENVNNYVGLAETLNRFNYLKNKYNNEMEEAKISK